MASVLLKAYTDIPSHAVGNINSWKIRARVVILDFGIRFETSAFSKNTDVTTISNGMVAHFDVTTKKFIISTAASPHSDYANAGNKYVVVATDSETIAIDGQKLVRLEVIV